MLRSISETILYILLLIITLLFIIFYSSRYHESKVDPVVKINTSGYIEKDYGQYIPSSMMEIYKNNGFQKINPFGTSVYSFQSMFYNNDNINDIYIQQESI